MKLLSPTPYRRLNEVIGVLLLAAGLVLLLSLVSYHVQDPSWDTATEEHPLNLVGYPGAYLSDLGYQLLGAGAFVLPFLILLLAWRWVRSEVLDSEGIIKIAGAGLLTLSLCTALSFFRFTLFGTVSPGGVVGQVIARYLLDTVNLAGALLVTATATLISVYLISAFTLSILGIWFAGPIGWMQRHSGWWYGWKDKRRRRALEKERVRQAKHVERLQERARQEAARAAAKEAARAAAMGSRVPPPPPEPPPAPFDDSPPWSPSRTAAVREEPEPEEAYEAAQSIPICPPEDLDPLPAPQLVPVRQSDPDPEPAFHPVFELPPTALLNEIPGRNAYDEAELKETAGRIKAKFEEFNVLGNVVQINPGPVVTTFEFKPEAGIKYSRITNLTEDLCLGLQAESILIERIPGKPTVGIEVPNTRRELIALRQMLESDEFQQSHSHLTIPLGKDINGRIRVAALDAMPHLLIAGSTGSGKSVMINSMIMSILYKATPDDVRLIMVDPKRVELGMYEGVPHLLTPVIIDPKKATNALRNAVLEMERRLRLLAEYGVRNIDQFNKKIRKLQEQPRSLFAEGEGTVEELRPLPYILILIDELADLMMLEGRNVEESVTRLAQMARAVGMHLVLATQRPSVDVITGLIKANFPARISFRVATRVDSRTILDVMGAEHLLGKGDMLFLPPGSSRLTRVHGAFVTETEINRVVDFWKDQAKPEYDQSFLIAPPTEEEAASEGEAGGGEQDPQYEEAVRLVLQMGKASTSTLQRHLRLGYGRAARILDMMQRDGIIGPPDGSKPREVLKRPDWLSEVENQLK